MCPTKPNFVEIIAISLWCLPPIVIRLRSTDRSAHVVRVAASETIARGLRQAIIPVRRVSAGCRDVPRRIRVTVRRLYCCTYRHSFSVAVCYTRGVFNASPCKYALVCQLRDMMTMQDRKQSFYAKSPSIGLRCACGENDNL